MTEKDLILKGKELLKPKNTKGIYSSEVKKDSFTTFSKVYPTTTENIKETYGLFDLSEKDVLTVTSSGDHIFCAIIEGARKIDSFDINYFAEYYYNLKKAMIESFSLEEFKNIMHDIVRGRIEKDVYLELRKKLNDNYQEFWDQIINFAHSNKYVINSLFFINSYILKNNLWVVNYLSEEKFNVLKEKLPNIQTNFIHCDLNDLDRELNQQYDYMFLSNIADYLTDSIVPQDKNWQKAKDIASDKLLPFIRKNGEIAYAYVYKAFSTGLEDFITQTDNLYPVTCVSDKKEKDFVLTLKK